MKNDTQPIDYNDYYDFLDESRQVSRSHKVLLNPDNPGKVLIRELIDTIDGIQIYDYYEAELVKKTF